MVKKYKLRFNKTLPLRKKVGKYMPATIEKEENEQIQDNLSMFNTMVLSPTKRQEMYDFYDKNYKETEDDRSFCKNMKNRRRLEK